MSAVAFRFEQSRRDGRMQSADRSRAVFAAPRFKFALAVLHHATTAVFLSRSTARICPSTLTVCFTSLLSSLRLTDVSKWHKLGELVSAIGGIPPSCDPNGGSLLKMQNRLAWYAIRVRPRYEKQIAQALGSKGIASFLPLYSARRKWSDRIKDLELPLFDGYVFCQANLDQRMPVLTIPGVIHFIGIGKMPQPIERHEIEALRQIVGTGSVARPWPFLREGERVRIEDGPLRSIEGILTRVGDTDQVVVSVTLLQRSVAVPVNRAWLSPMRVWMRRSPSAHLNICAT